MSMQSWQLDTVLLRSAVPNPSLMIVVVFICGEELILEVVSTAADDSRGVRLGRADA